MITTLHIDESGAFHATPDKPADADVLVAAYGLPGDALTQADRALRTATAERWPFIPWPLHRAHLFEPSWLVLCHGAWSLGRALHRPPVGLAAAAPATPTDSAGFRALADRLRPFVDEFGLGDDWHALHAWGARRGFDLVGPGAERLKFCRRADEALARARPAADALERAVDRIKAGFTLPIRTIRDFDPIFFPRGVPSDLRTAMALIQQDTLVLFRIARDECDRRASPTPSVLVAAEAAPKAACDRPDRYLALLRTLLEIVAGEPGLAPTSLLVEGRRVAREAAEGKGASRLGADDLRRLLDELPDHDWGEARVIDKRRSWAEPDIHRATASQAAAPHDHGVLGSKAGSPRNTGLEEDLGRLARHPPGLVLADFAAFELRHRLGFDREGLARFVKASLHASFETEGRLHAGAFPGPSSSAARPWARRLP